MNPFRWIVLAFRAAVRSEVERAMADRRAALSRDPDDAETRRLKAFLGKSGLTVRRPATVIPMPANDLTHTSPPPPSVA